MSQKLKHFLEKRGYNHVIFMGYFRQKIDKKALKNGYHKEIHPYEIKNLYLGKNPKVILARMNILRYYEGNFYKVKTLEDPLSSHLEDPIFKIPKEKPLPFGAIGRLPEFKKLELLLKNGIIL